MLCLQPVLPVAVPPTAGLSSPLHIELGKGWWGFLG